MTDSRWSLMLKLPRIVQATFVCGARDSEPVRGLTHNFYRYPARFSPAFARAAIEAFTEPGELVLDPHVGGSTALVEALALGRDAVGIDISALAEFVGRVKTTVFKLAELDRLDAWVSRLPAAVHMRKPARHFAYYAEQGYYKHLEHSSRWRLRKAIEQGISSAIQLGDPRLESFGRCAVLRTAQWALDGRKNLPSTNEFRAMLAENAATMVAGARELRAAVMKHSEIPKIRLLHRSAAGVEDDKRMVRWPAPKLVLTSPPYPGVHVLYHRWQVDGRKEAPAPFWIANKLDGSGASYYTMGDRKYPQLKTSTLNATTVASNANTSFFI
jgi:hypothetical protein